MFSVALGTLVLGGAGEICMPMGCIYRMGNGQP
jgi:hypothetical protein